MYHAAIGLEAGGKCIQGSGNVKSGIRFIEAVKPAAVCDVGDQPPPVQFDEIHTVVGLIHGGVVAVQIAEGGGLRHKGVSRSVLQGELLAVVAQLKIFPVNALHLAHGCIIVSLFLQKADISLELRKQEVWIRDRAEALVGLHVEHGLLLIGAQYSLYRGFDIFALRLVSVSMGAQKEQGGSAAQRQAKQGTAGIEHSLFRPAYENVHRHSPFFKLSVRKHLVIRRIRQISTVYTAETFH